MRIEALAGVVRSIAAAQTSAQVLFQAVEGLAACPSVVLARLWLVRRGRLEPRERVPGEPVPGPWLELAASAGNFRRPGTDPRQRNGRFARLEIGKGKVGGVAATGEPAHLERLEDGDPWILDQAWVRDEGVRSFAAQALVVRGEILGVLALFDREPLPESHVAGLGTLADHAAIALANARALEELEAQRARLERENAYLREEIREPFRALLGRAPALQKVRHQIETVAPTEASVLVLGESGAGKELVAHAVHAQSPRRDGPLVHVRCGAVPRERFESELLGHVRGAFAEATHDRVGRFELADGGTLFLDEVGEIPLEHQAKLLRVLQEGTFQRLGDARTRAASVRVVAASRRDLSELADQGRFRSDLYYRLSVFPIEVPPLRERREDVAELAAHFVRRAARRLGLRTPVLTRAQEHLLAAYDWPGNVRELEHVVERAVLLGRGHALEFPELAPGPALPRFPARRPAAAPLPTLAELKLREKEVIAAALAEAGGKVSGPGGAAERLGVKPTTLESKLRALGIRPRGPRRGPRGQGSG